MFTVEIFFNITSVANEPWCDAVITLPHMQQLSQFKHFEDIEILGLDNCNAVDVLIGNDNAHLMYAKQERVGDSLTESHEILFLDFSPTCHIDVRLKEVF